MVGFTVEIFGKVTRPVVETAGFVIVFGDVCEDVVIGIVVVVQGVDVVFICVDLDVIACVVVERFDCNCCVADGEVVVDPVTSEAVAVGVSSVVCVCMVVLPLPCIDTGSVEDSPFADDGDNDKIVGFDHAIDIFILVKAGVVEVV